MPLWQRLLIALAIMIMTSLVAGLLWRWLFNTGIPSYLNGVVGGVSAAPIWKLLRRIEYGESQQRLGFERMRRDGTSLA